MSERYFLTDDSCEPLDIESLSIESCSTDELECDSWTYSSKKQVIDLLEKILKRMKE